MPTKIKTFDIGLIAIPILILAVGIAEIYSLSTGTTFNDFGSRQLLFALIGIGLLFFVSFLDYHFFKGTAWVFYLVSVLLLIAVDVFGKTANGATNWLNLGFFQLQPSELTKIFMIIALSAFLSEKIGKIRFRDILLSIVIISPSLYMVLKEPDFGAALIIILIFFSLLFWSKPSKIQIIIIIAFISSLIAIVMLAYYNVAPFGRVIKDYQRHRIAVFLNPELDPYGKGYNVRQAQIAIGSGGIVGKGLGKGPQSQLQFLPEPHTDFIIAGIGESFGFLGVFIIMALYSVFVIKLLNIARSARDNFGMLVVLGVMAMFLFQIIINISMNMGMMPVTGITLPLLSYGGTSLIVSLFAIGLAQSIYIRHKKINF